MKAQTLRPSAAGLMTILEPVMTPALSSLCTLWWTAAPEMLHSLAISRKGVLALLTSLDRIFLSISSIW